jgi:hypothetical protein
VLYRALLGNVLMVCITLPCFTGQCIDGMYRLLRLGSIDENSKEEG